jgi:hypothetical protein
VLYSSAAIKGEIMDEYYESLKNREKETGSGAFICSEKLLVKY